MKKNKIKVSGIEEAILLYNPFVFKDQSGRFMMFPTLEDSYYELLQRIYDAGPTMVDVIVFFVDTYGMPYVEAQNYVRGWLSVIGMKEAVFLFDWKNGGKQRDADLEKFARGMHLMSETKFNKDMFLGALAKFKKKMHIED